MNMHGLVSTRAPAAVIIIRLLVGLVFLSQGIQKFLLPDAVGAGRFARLGFSSPEFTAMFVAIFEITCGVLVLLGFLTRLAVIPLLVIMAVAIWKTKMPTLLEKGFWVTAHEGRTDFAMTLALIFLFVVGAGRWSIDAATSRAE